jgi:hypothetical protein
MYITPPPPPPPPIAEPPAPPPATISTSTVAPDAAADTEKVPEVVNVWTLYAPTVVIVPPVAVIDSNDATDIQAGE